MSERINKLSSNIYEQLGDKGQSFTAFSAALGESTDWADNAQPSIFIREKNDKCKVTEEFMS